MREATVLEAIVRRFAQRMQRAGERIQMDVRIAEDFDGWCIDGHLTTFRWNGHTSTRHASVDVPARAMMVACSHGDGSAVDYVNDHIRRLESLLHPGPFPPFRIGTKPHPKRLRLAA